MHKAGQGYKSIA